MSPHNNKLETKLRRQNGTKANIINSDITEEFGGEFIWELENSYELSPKLSQKILLSAKECLLKESLLVPSIGSNINLSSSS